MKQSTKFNFPVEISTEISAANSKMEIRQVFEAYVRLCFRPHQFKIHSRTKVKHKISNPQRLEREREFSWRLKITGD